MYDEEALLSTVGGRVAGAVSTRLRLHVWLRGRIGASYCRSMPIRADKRMDTLYRR